MCPKLYNNLVAYCVENKGNGAFISMNAAAIEEIILGHLILDSCLYEHTGEKIHGVVLWDVKKYLPMEIEIVEAICDNNHILADLLTKIANQMPPAFRCFAQRKCGTRRIEYKNPRKVIQKIRNFSWVPTRQLQDHLAL